MLGLLTCFFMHRCQASAITTYTIEADAATFGIKAGPQPALNADACMGIRLTQVPTDGSHATSECGFRKASVSSRPPSETRVAWKCGYE